MKTSSNSNRASQSTMQAMETYFNAQDAPSSLRVNDSGDIEIAGKLTLLFERIKDGIGALVDKDYKPTDWRKLAHDALEKKLTSNLQILLPKQDENIDSQVGQLIANTCDRLQQGNGMTWRGALATELEIITSTNEGVAVSTATRLLLDIGKLTSPEIEIEVLKKIGRDQIDFVRLSPEGQEKIMSIIKESISSHLQKMHDFPWVNVDFGAEVLIYAMNQYQLPLPEAMKLLDIPATLMLENGFIQRPESTPFILEQIARTIHRETGVSLERAKSNAKNIEYCMRRYGMNWKHALDLVGLAGRIAKLSNKPNSAEGENHVPKVDMDKARAVQQVMARDHCTLNHALEIVERRIKALPRIRQCLPVNAIPSIAGEMTCSVETAISEGSRIALHQAVSTLNLEARGSWSDPSTKTGIKLADSFLIDSVRNLRIGLNNQGKFNYFDAENAEGLIDGVYEFAGNPDVMIACSDSFNQTILGSMLNIVFAEQQNILTDRPEKKGDQKTEMLWHMGKRDDQGTLTFRHLYLQRVGTVRAMSSGDNWPVNEGRHWAGDANPLTAGLVLDFSYSFKEDDLKKGLRNPEILECRYSFNLSLDWDAIDLKLAEEAAPHVSP